jgi:hypothetical protein
MTRIYWPGTRIVRSTNNGFTRGFTGEPIDWKPLQRSANARRRSTANVDSARKTGKDLSTMHGISKKADSRIVAQRSRTFLIEGRDAGQCSTEKRAALRRGGR